MTFSLQPEYKNMQLTGRYRTLRSCCEIWLYPSGTRDILDVGFFRLELWLVGNNGVAVDEGEVKCGVGNKRISGMDVLFCGDGGICIHREA